MITISQADAEDSNSKQSKNASNGSSGGEKRERVHRVTQLDALELDSQLMFIVKQQLLRALKAFPPYIVDRWVPEIEVILQITIWHFSVRQTDTSFGQQLLGIKYQKLDDLRKALLLAPAVIGYVKSRTEGHCFRGDTTLDRAVSLAAHFVKIAVDVGSFFNLLIFLRGGTYPSLLMRFLGLRMGYSKSERRSVGYSHMTRELLWHGFAELLVYVTPFIGYRKLRRLFFKTIWGNKHVRRLDYIPLANLTTKSICHICSQRPVLPHHMGCGHVFCYFCLKGSILADSNFECPECGHQAKGPSSVEPLTVENHKFSASRPVHTAKS